MDRILARGQLFLLGLSGIYIVFIALVITPVFQRHVVFLNAVRWPLFPDFASPVKYGLAVHRSLNLYIETPDAVRLGAWLYLPPSIPGDIHVPPSSEIVNASFSSRPTILLLHGNAASRAVRFRVEICLAYASHFDANVLAIDYRGFGDSTGVPSEEGLVIDARAAFDWVVGRGAKREEVLLVGMSLGTGVAAALGAQLSDDGIRPKGVALLAPFTSVKDLLIDYHLLGIFPILQPLQPLPAIRELLTTRYLRTHFNTTSAVSRINAPILIAHAQDDADIPYTHSQSLFNTLLSPLLPIVPAAPTRPSELQDFDWSAHRSAVERRDERRAEVLHVHNIPEFGTVQSFAKKHREGSESAEVVYVEGLWGGHDRIGLQQTLIDVFGSVFFPKPSL